MRGMRKIVLQNKKSVIKAIIFDLDDTLYPERMFVMSGFQAVSNYLSEKCNISPKKIFNILKEDFEKGFRKKNFDILLKKLQIDDEFLLDEIIKIYRNHFPTISLDAQTKSFLDKLRTHFKLALITDGYPTTQKNKISALGLSEYFDLVKINDISKGEDKTDPDIFQKFIVRIGEINQNILFIGDNPLKDFTLPKKFGLHTVRIIRKGGVYSHIKKNLRFIDYTIHKLEELFEIIEDIEKNDG